jgi:hypothetical protein
MHLFIALPVHGGDGLGIPIVVVETRPGGYYMHVYPERFHVGEALLRCPDRTGSNAYTARPDAVPVFPGLPGLDETLRCQMSVNVDAAHVCLPTYL